MKVLVIPAWFNNTNLNEGVFIHKYCEVLKKNGMDVSLLYIKTYGIRNIVEYFRSIKYGYPVTYKIIEVKKIVWPGIARSKTGIRAFKTRLLKKAYRRLKPEKPEIIHLQSVCNNLTSYIGKELAGKIKIPYVITEHYTSFKEAGDVLFKPFMSLTEVVNIVKGANSRVAVSKFSAKMYHEIFDTDFKALPNIMSPVFFEMPFAAKNKITDEFVFLFVGSLTRRKGIHVLLDAVKQLKREKKKIKLEVIGTGEEFDSAQRFIMQEGLEGHVILYGYKTESEIVDFMDRSHALILPSEKETFGLVVVESLLRGRPVLAFDLEPLKEILSVEDGLLVKNTGTVDGLVNGIRAFITDYSGFDQNKIRERAISKFNEKAIVNAYADIYQSAINDERKKL